MSATSSATQAGLALRLSMKDQYLYASTFLQGLQVIDLNQAVAEYSYYQQNNPSQFAQAVTTDGDGFAMDTIVNTIPLPLSQGTATEFGIKAADFATSAGNGVAATQPLIVATGRLPLVVADPFAGSNGVLYPPYTPAGPLTDAPLQMTMTSAGQTTTYSLTNGVAVDVGTIAVPQNGAEVDKTIAVLVGSGTVNGVGEPLLAVVDISQPYVPGSQPPYTPGSPYLPTPIGFFQLSANPTDVILDVDNMIALVGTGSNVLIVDLTDPTHPVNGGTITGTFGNFLALDSHGDLVAAGNTPSKSVQTVALSSPVTVNAINFTGNCPQVTPPGESGTGAGCINVFNDQIGSAPLIKNPIWKASNAASANYPVAYVQGQTISLTVTLGLNPVPTVPINNVTITGQAVGLGNCTATGQTFLTQPTFTFSCTMDTPLPANKTKFYNPLVINWSYTVGTTTTFIGPTKNQVYVTLAPPLQYNPNPQYPLHSSQNKVYRTTLELALSTDGATDSTSAWQNTWYQFAVPIPSSTDPTATAPANIKTWDGRPLYYYLAGHGFGPVCALDEYSLLTYQAEVFDSNGNLTGYAPSGGSGQCGSFANLLRAALAVNGVPSVWVVISAVDSSTFLVSNWAFGTPTLSPPWPYLLLQRDEAHPPAANADGSEPACGGITYQPNTVQFFGLVPPCPNNQFGDLAKNPVPGLAGQNTASPSESAFGFHFIVGSAGPSTRY